MSRTRAARSTRLRAPVLAAVLCTAGAASAAPDDVVARPLVLPRFGVEAAAVLELDVSRRLGEPASLAPDVWFGATDDLTVGVVHSARALSIVDAGLGVCFRGEEHGCPRAYDNVGVEARWSLARGALAAAARGRFVVRTFDAWKPRFGAGALVRWSRGRLGITGDPALSVGLANRDEGNRAQLDVPLWLAVQPTCRWALHVRTGVHGSLATFGDTFEVPIGLGVTAAAHRRVDIAVEAAFRRLLGPLNDYKNRMAWVALTVRWP